MTNSTPQAFRLPYPDRPFHHLLEDVAERHPERIGLLFESDRYTYRELDGLSNALAHGLAGLGIGRGDRVALYLTNRPEWVIAFFAVSKLGASVVLISSAWKAGEVQHAMQLTGPKAVIADGDGLKTIDELETVDVRITADDDADGWHSLWSLVRKSPATRDNRLDGDLSSWELALPFSSGTTGMPKAVRHSHRSLTAGTIQWKANLNMDGSDAIQTFTPLAHILGIVNIGAGVASGAPVRLFRRFDLEAVMRSIEEDRITIGIAVAPIAVAMANMPDLENYDLSSLRYFNWSATPVSQAIANRFTERTGIRWLAAYGATESIVLFSNPAKYPDLWRLDSAGLPASDVEARIVDLDSLEPLPPGERGELIVRNVSTTLGYLPDEANDGAFLPGGWYRTGDVGWMESDGWLHLTDRVKEMIKVSAFQVAPAELESVLFEHPGVADCAVFGVADDVKGQVPQAVVVPQVGRQLDPDEVIDWVGTRLATYKRLTAVHVVDEIPRTASGKTLRRALTDRFKASDQ